MTLSQQFGAELDREAARTRRVLHEVPHDRDDWKPHPKSMALGRLAALVAMMPSWFNLMIEKDELDLTPPSGGSQFHPPPTNALVPAHDDLVKKAHEAISKAKDDFLLNTRWRLKAGGHVVGDQPRYIVIEETFCHWAHHRAQLTVYLRLLDRKVPSVYGPTADDQSFG